ncbi:hypothetical protein [Streptomyces triticisoli]|uniref:hypothetical protein n=1 Tax=Streptomyces triticisoli TaxID=2182797 RepID=UPI000DDBA8CE|nr:hypothetical protein [Streptomyces triticisoli]
MRVRAMPAPVRAVRVMLFLVSAVSGFMALRFTVAAATVVSGAFGEPAVSLFLLAALPFAVLATLSLLTAVRTGHGGNGVRVVAVVVARLVVAGGTVGAAAHHGAWSAGAVMGVVMLIAVTGEDAKDWFGIPRL